MGCECSYGYGDCEYDYEPCDIWREGRIQKTRKAHHCEECWEVIPKGSRCCYVEQLYDHRWLTIYRCIRCSTLAELVAEELKECPAWGAVFDRAMDAGIDLDEWR